MKEMRIAGSRGMQSGTESRIEQSRLNERERERVVIVIVKCGGGDVVTVALVVVWCELVKRGDQKR